VLGVLQYATTDRDLGETMLKPRFDAIQTLPTRWAEHYLPELEKPADAPDLEHRKAGDRTNAHDVTIRPQTQLASAMKLEALPTNSRHHQGIAKVGHGLVASAFAPDGIVEAVEDPTLPFWVAVQWHPENLFNTPHERLFQALVEAARKYRDLRQR